MRLHDLSITAFGPFVDSVHVDFDDLAAAGLFLLTGDTGVRQDERARRRVLRALRRGSRRPAHRTPPAQRPGGSAHRARRRPAAQRRGPDVPVHPLAGLGTTQATRQRHHPGPGPRRGRGAAGRRMGRTDQPARRGGPARHRPAGHDLHAVHAGGDAAPGALPGLPAGQLDRTPRRAATTVPHPAVRGGRTLARREAARARPRVSDPPRRVRGGGQPPPGSGRDRGARRLGPARPRRGGRRRFPRALGRRASDGGISRARGSACPAVERHRIARTRPGGTRPGACRHRCPFPRGCGAEGARRPRRLPGGRGVDGCLARCASPRRPGSAAGVAGGGRGEPAQRGRPSGGSPRRRGLCAVGRGRGRGRRARTRGRRHPVQRGAGRRRVLAPPRAPAVRENARGFVPSIPKPPGWQRSSAATRSGTPTWPMRTRVSPPLLALPPRSRDGQPPTVRPSRPPRRVSRRPPRPRSSPPSWTMPGRV